MGYRALEQNIEAKAHYTRRCVDNNINHLVQKVPHAIVTLEGLRYTSHYDHAVVTRKKHFGAYGKRNLLSVRATLHQRQ